MMMMMAATQEEAKEKEEPRVALIAKRGPHSKWFDAHAARVAGPLLRASFGSGCSKATIRDMSVRFVATLTVAEEVVALALVTQTRKEGLLKVGGVCVAPGLRGRGYGTRLMERLPGLLQPTTLELELCVDEGTPTTARLRAWYERLGYEWRGTIVRPDGDEARMVHRISVGPTAVAVL